MSLARPAHLLPLVVTFLIAPTVVAFAGSGAVVARHPKFAAGVSQVPRLAPVLRRMLAEEFGPGWPNITAGARQLEKGQELEREEAAVPAVLGARPETPLVVQTTTPGLAVDALVNDKTTLTCLQCKNLPIAQDEASVAVYGTNVVVSFNDVRSSCGTVTRQDVGFSTDGGATFVDNHGIPKAGNGGNLWGDGSVAVNHKTGEFYIGGLYQVPRGVGATRGHFAGNTFVWDGIGPTALQGPDFFDKPWMTVDSLSGNLYMSWTNFTATGTSYIEFQRCDSALTPLGTAQVLSDTTNVGWGVQFSQMAVGPGGVLYVIWQQFWPPPGLGEDGPLQVAVRRSNDFGVSWGPVVYVAPPHAYNDSNGGPGFLRPFASLQPTIAVDNSNGSHRGRVYVAWDEALDYLSAPLLLTTTRFEAEPNNTPATANLLVPGGKLRGTKSGIEEDWFRIDLNAGDTYYQSDQYFLMTAGYDSTREDIYAQMYSPDLAGNLHLAANAAGGSGSLLYTAPRTASYYLRLFGTTTQVSPYILLTALIPSGSLSGPARDARDQVMAWSDDGTSWSSPVRMNDSPPGADAQYPSIGVDGRGRVYCSWMDWRDDHESGTASTQYMAISGDGGITWGANQRIGDAVYGWSTNVCQSNGNTQGDYQFMATDGDRVVTAFTDGRLGDPDVFVDASVFTASATAPAAFVAEAGRDTSFQMELHNDGNFGRQLEWQLSDGAGWLTGATSASPTLAAHDSVAVTVSLHPTGAPGDSTVVQLAHGDPFIPGYTDAVTTVVHLTTPVGVPRAGPVALFFAPPEPSPSRGPVTLRYGLPSPGRVRLTIYSVLGTRVRTLVDGSTGAGSHALAWDGRDARGRSVPAGVYLARLDTKRSSLTRRLIVAP